MGWRRMPDCEAAEAMSEALRRGLIEASRRREVPENWRWPSRLVFVLATPGLLWALVAGFVRDFLGIAACLVVYVIVRAAITNPMSGAALWLVLVVGGGLGAVAARASGGPACDGCSERNRCGASCPDVPPLR